VRGVGWGLFVQSQDLLAKLAVGGEVVDERFAALGAAVFGQFVIALSIEGKTLATAGQRSGGDGAGDDDASEGADPCDPGWVHIRSPA
jgi:hypothetical protein